MSVAQGESNSYHPAQNEPSYGLPPFLEAGLWAQKKAVL
jgi:hypothetical protein